MKTINLLIGIFAITTISLFSCERPTSTQNPLDIDSIKVNRDTITANPDTIKSDTIAPKDERHVPSVYLVNQLDMPIDLEMHHDSFPLSVQEELSWYRNAGVQNFTLQPNDTVYCDSIVYFTNDAERYFIFPGTNSYNGLVSSYFRIKINYNDNQYEYTDKADIQMLLRADSYWYIIFNEEKKNYFGWE
jgi:hypothetical protein